MKTLIIIKSVHHMNTEKVAKAMAEELDASIWHPEDVDISSLEEYDMIGFGSGIYHGKHHKALWELAGRLPPANKAAFVFSTCGLWREGFHNSLREILVGKGYDIVGEFHCNGWDTYGPLRLIGGLKKGHPDAKDIERAQTFARNLANKMVC